MASQTNMEGQEAETRLGYQKGMVVIASCQTALTTKI